MAQVRFLLDTNILSAVIKNPLSPLAARLAAASIDELGTSIVVACELRYGARKKGSRALTTRVEQFLATIPVLPLEGEVDRHYGTLRVALERRGQPIGSNDLLIAAHALALGAVLVTANERESKRVPGLKVENWLAL
ncbi:MAG: type II toxin-antitoxin system VapC family toxin [Betaproteobacteria bacterium]|nr:type II toxin-antitoxin system VapC family toxin [Betaproteobacteria bacterium]